jgi:uncharacterized protein (TIGR00645 family)
MSTRPHIERTLERLMYASRWILAPIYLGMSLALFTLFIKFVQEPDLILKLLTLIDLSMVGSLLVIVIFSGYENFVSRLDIEDATKKLDWLGTHDYGSLKMKVASSIVAISSIHLLKVFMNIMAIDNNKLVWYVLIHLTLVISALLMAFQDKLTKH